MTSTLQRDYLWVGLLQNSLGVHWLLLNKYTCGYLYVYIGKLQPRGAWDNPNI